MFHADVKRVDVVIADVAVNVVFFAAGVFAVAVVVENGDVGNDDFNKTIIWCLLCIFIF